MSKKQKNESSPGASAETEPQTTPDPVADPAAEAEKFRDLAMRTAADFDNFRKRAAREKEDSIRYANTSLLGDLLPLIDNFELGLEAAKSAPNAGAILQGLGMVARQFRDFLSSAGLEEVMTEGAIFDPRAAATSCATASCGRPASLSPKVPPPDPSCRPAIPGIPTRPSGSPAVPPSRKSKPPIASSP